MLGALASIRKPGAQIGSWSSWTQARGPELVDLMLGDLFQEKADETEKLIQEVLRELAWDW